MEVAAVSAGPPPASSHGAAPATATAEAADGVDEAGSSTQSLLQWWWFVITHHEKETGREEGYHFDRSGVPGTGPWRRAVALLPRRLGGRGGAARRGAHRERCLGGPPARTSSCTSRDRGVTPQPLGRLVDPLPSDGGLRGQPTPTSVDHTELAQERPQRRRAPRSHRQARRRAAQPRSTPQ